MYIELDFGNEIVYQIFSFISLIGSFLIVLTGIIFPILLLNKKRILSYFIFFISLCNFFGCIGTFFGFPNKDSIICKIQSVLVNFFIPTSWGYMTVLIYQLRCVIMDRKIWLGNFGSHFIIWIFSISFLLLPLTTNSFGINSNLEGQQICNLSGPTSSANGWIVGFFLGRLIICFVVILMWSVHIKITFKREKESNLKVIEFGKYIRYYPISMLICWLPWFVLSMCNQLGAITTDYVGTVNILSQFFSVLSTQNGTLVAIIYFYNNEEARYKWKKMLSGNNSNEIEFFENNIEEDIYEMLQTGNFSNNVSRFTQPYIPNLERKYSEEFTRNHSPFMGDDMIVKPIRINSSIEYNTSDHDIRTSNIQSMDIDSAITPHRINSISNSMFKSSQKSRDQSF